MLFLLLAWVYIFLLSTVYGLLAINLLGKIRSTFKCTLPSPEIISLAGFCLLGWLLSLLHFFMPINGWAHVILGTGACLSFIFNFNSSRKTLNNLLKSVNKPLFFWLLLFGFGLFILLQAAQPPTFPDTGSYHAQFITWLQQYRIVPGLGNLHGRLAFNSQVHLLAAFFSWPNLGPGPLHQAFGSYLFLILSSFTLRKLYVAAQNQPAEALFYGGFLAALFICFRPWLSSPMPDSTVAIFTFFVIALLLEKLRQNQPAKPDLQAALIMLLLATLISFKLSAALLFPLLVFQLWHLPKSQRFSWFLTAAAFFAFVLTPWLIRNVVLSGHLIYPLSGLDLLNFDWEIPQAQVIWEQREIVHFARRPDAFWRTNMGEPLWQWFPAWFRNQEKISQLLFILWPGLLLWHVSVWLKRNLKNNLNLFLLFVALSVSCGLWFFTAPAFRFAYGYLIGATLTGALLLLPAKLPRTVGYGVASLCLLYCLNGIRNALKSQDLTATFLWPAPYKTVPVRPQKLGEQVIFVRPDDGRCWNTPLPCTYQLTPGLQMRGNSLQHGFRIKKAGKASEPDQPF